MLTEFILYLTEQIGEPYLWGGQHTRLTPENYKTVIARKESKPANRVLVEQYCEKKFAEGYTELFAYDCSGLGVYWLQNVKHIWAADVNANTMMHRCVDLDTAGPPAKGWWVFRLDDAKKRAVHIGYMIDNEYLIEAAGRKYGVVKTKFRAHEWDAWGIPKVFEDEIRHPEPKPEPTGQVVEVIGGSVNVRNADSKKGRILFTAHRGDTFPYLGPAPSGWYTIQTKKGVGYITNLPRYTMLKE